jgi:serine protease AprX
MTWGARIALLALVTLLAAALSFADGKKHKLSNDLDALKGGHDGATVDVIIQFNQTPTAAHHHKVQSKGGVLKTNLDFIKGAHYSVPTGSLEALENDPDVAYVSPDREVYGTLDYVTSAVGAPTAWFTYSLFGTGVGVAVIDSGIHSNMPDFNSWFTGKNRVVYSQDFVGGGPDDIYGHGTHVAGIVGGAAKSSYCSNCTRTLAGVAPDVNLINLRVLDKNGNGSDSKVIRAIQQAITLKNAYNIRVINLSLGRPVQESYTLDPLCQAVEAAWNAGIVVVVAAGNNGRDNSMGTNGYGTIAAPGNDPYVITVGAMKTNGTYSIVDDTIASYSSKGPTGFDHFVKPDLVAPGNRVVSDMNMTSTLATNNKANIVALNYYENTSSTKLSPQYFMLSGTSMATPVVSGAAALLIQQYPSLTPDQVKARLMKTASKTFPASSSVTDPSSGITYTDYYDIFTIGAGYLNIPAALANNDLASSSAMSPSVVYDQVTGTVELVNETSVVWGTNAVWDSSVVWGTNVFVNGTSVVWGTSVCWGSSINDGFSVVWGTGVLLGDPSTDRSTAMSSGGVAVTGEN